MSQFLFPLRADAARPEAFDAAVRSTRIGTITITHWLATPFSLARARSATRHAGPALSVLTFSSPERVSVDHDFSHHEVRAGQLIVLTNTTNAAVSMDTVSAGVLVNIPLAAIDIDLREAAARLEPVPPDTALVRAATTFINSVVRDDPGRPPSDKSDALTQDALTRLVTSIAAQQRYRVAPVEVPSQTVREAVRTIIDREFRDPDLGAQAVADALGLSRRQLYRHFSEVDESPADLIAMRRLTEVRRLLTAVPDMPLPDVALASGFSSVPTMRQRLRAVFGISLSEARAAGPPVPVHPATPTPPGREPGEVVDPADV
ncbi:AraC family transcriptional regulator [Gordonia sp. NPDC127522]|uniref:AraC family transcriptional regulator n=1 Tax=Gordonia sp. NPDC127522 TaxID=3345390 RepID=UPI00363CF05F